MKKKWLLFIISVVILTGCGNTKTLTCTTGDGDVGEIYTFKFTKEKLKTIVVKEIVEAESKEEAEAYKKQVEEELKIFAKMYNLTTKVTVKDKKVTSIIEVDIDKLADENKNDFENATYEEMKKNSEKAGMSCK